MLNSEQIRTIIRDTVAGFDTAALKDEQEFRDAGIDSLDSINILLALEEAHGVHIPDADVKQCNSIQGILDYLSRH